MIEKQHTIYNTHQYGASSNGMDMSYTMFKNQTWLVRLWRYKAWREEESVNILSRIVTHFMCKFILLQHFHKENWTWRTVPLIFRYYKHAYNVTSLWCHMLSWQQIKTKKYVSEYTWISRPTHLWNTIRITDTKLLTMRCCCYTSMNHSMRELRFISMG